MTAEQVRFVTEREESINLYQWSKQTTIYYTNKEYIHVKCVLNEQVSQNR